MQTLNPSDFPAITTGKNKPSYTDEEIWNQAGERGCYSASAPHFKFCFDFIVHKDGVLLYRMKRKNERNYKIGENEGDHAFFKGVLFHDPMEVFMTRESINKDRRDNIVIIKTHSNEEKFDCWETYCTVPYEEFQHYLDPHTPMNCFWSDVACYLESKRTF
jgi:hypothetical protein